MEEETITSKHHTCRPPKGMTYLTIGQDFMSIYNYILAQYNATLHSMSSLLSSSISAIPILADFYPAAVMVYTDLESLQGLNQPIDYGSGVGCLFRVLYTYFVYLVDFFSFILLLFCSPICFR